MGMHSQERNLVYLIIATLLPGMDISERDLIVTATLNISSRVN